HNPAIDSLIQDNGSRLKWVSGSEIDDKELTQIDNIYRAHGYIILVLLANSEECTPTLVSEFARIYSLPVHKYNNVDNNNFRRYSVWLEQRNELIIGFTEYDGNYYMVADRRLYDY